jgi:hypothetical protein
VFRAGSGYFCAFSMDEQRTIYVVTAGEYSDYGIRGVFDDRELAEAFAERSQRYDSARIEEWDLNPFTEELREGLVPYFVSLKRNGDVGRIWVDNPPASEITPSMGLTCDRTEAFTTCFARDEAHAVKIANERRAQFIASGGWD